MLSAIRSINRQFFCFLFCRWVEHTTAEQQPRDTNVGFTTTRNTHPILLDLCIDWTPSRSRADRCDTLQSSFMLVQGSANYGNFLEPTPLRFVALHGLLGDVEHNSTRTEFIKLKSITTPRSTLLAAGKKACPPPRTATAQFLPAAEASVLTPRATCSVVSGRKMHEGLTAWTEPE